MLQYFISVFFVAVGVITVFTIVDSCKKASKQFRSLMHERKVLDQTWPEVEIGFSPRSSEPIAQTDLVQSSGAISVRQSVFDRGLWLLRASSGSLRAAEGQGLGDSVFFGMTRSPAPAAVAGEVA
jgi:hypothetical protein